VTGGTRTPLEPAFTGRPLGRFGFGHRAQRRNRTSVPRVWTGRSSIELAELERAQEESNPHLQVRNLVPLSFRRWALEYPQHELNVPLQVVVLVLCR
jgi:hypothetical protein